MHNKRVSGFMLPTLLFLLRSDSRYLHIPL
nr:MAG TPA: hypothetical protein [Caudoviricetes sp.]